MIDLSGHHKRLTIVVGESDTVDGEPLATAIVHRAHAAGMAGVTVLRGIEGYGASNHIHTTRVLSLSSDLPIMILIVDTEESITSFLSDIEPLVDEGLITVEDVHVARYVGREGDRG
jgi:PII-like signaling protein